MKYSIQRLNSELEHAREYMQAKLPKELNQPIRVLYRYIPSLEIGGDGFGYHFYDDDHFIIYLIDVAGEGVSAAIHSNSILHVLHHLVEIKNPLLLRPDQVLKELNAEFQMEENAELFFTIWYGVYQISSSMLSYATGGHHPAVLLGKEKKLLLKTSSKLMGVDKKNHFLAKSVKINPQDTLFLFSDGVFEYEQNKKSYTFEDFCTFLEEIELNSCDALDEVERRSFRLSGNKPFPDDFSILQITF